jgi:hypothetical protein
LDGIVNGDNEERRIINSSLYYTLCRMNIGYSKRNGSIKCTLTNKLEPGISSLWQSQCGEDWETKKLLINKVKNLTPKFISSPQPL